MSTTSSLPTPAHPHRTTSAYIRWPGPRLTSAEIGGKAAALNALRDADVAVPDWFALTPAALVDSLPEQQRRALRAGTTPDLADLMPAETVAAALNDALDRLAGPSPCRFAVRSSAVDEDGARHSYAGQLASFLDVPAGEVAARAAEVWHSAFHPRVQAYRRRHGLAADASPPAVLVQRMVEPDASGVAFSADPSDGRRGVVVVSAVHGTSSALLDGTDPGTTYRVDRAGQIVEHGGNTMTDDAVRQVAALARTAERHFARPQDVEWALENGRLFLLQSRPITTLRDLADPDGTLILWDDSNIAESYTGITTPLTFSFARRAYRSAYRTFCRTLGVPEERIEAHAAVFDSMIGLIRGRLFYNLASWHRVLALLPGYRFNRAFMEDMMGVRERLPASLLPGANATPRREQLRDGWHLVRSAWRLARHHRRISDDVAAFREHVDEVLGTPEPSLEVMRLDELAAYYRHLEDELLQRWDVPIVNDFLTMIFFGLSRRLLDRWTDDGESLHAHLLTNAREVLSTEPVRRVRAMASLIAEDAPAARVLAMAPRREVEAMLASRPPLRRHLDAYLERFGDRCLGELKLESIPLNEDPLPVLRTVGVLAQRLGDGDAPTSVPADAGAVVDAALAGRPVRRRLVQWALRHARARIADREALRFDRTRAFGRARRIFLEVGRRLFADGHLNAPRDVFYLEVDELLGFVGGTGTTTDLAGLARVRRAEFDRHRDAPAPASRFTTRGAVHQGNRFEDDAPPIAADGDGLTGVGCGTGRARGRVQVVHDPRGVTLHDDAILVAEHTDPGWVTLFAACRGVIVERGNLLSHAAVVAREIGLPAVVSVDGATQCLHDGELVEIDGRAGTVRRLDTLAD